MLIFTEGGKPENPVKTPRSKGENQEQIKLTYESESPGIEPESTVVRGEQLAATPPILSICFFPSLPLAC
jgi:hypothetical protein